MVALFLFGSCALSSTALTFVAQGSGNVGRDAELPRGMGAGSWDICARGQPFARGIVFRQLRYDPTPLIVCRLSL